MGASQNKLSTDYSRMILNIPAHGFVWNGIPIPARVDNSGGGVTYVGANANNMDTLVDFYIVEVIDADHIMIMHSGILELPAHGLNVADNYYLSDTADGEMTTTQPTIGIHCMTVITNNTVVLTIKNKS